MEISIKDVGDLSTPQARVRAIEATTKGICQAAGVDMADATMMLLTAACHIAMQGSGKTAAELLDTMAYSLGCATIAADDFFKLKPVAKA